MIVVEGGKCKQTSGKYSFEKCNPAKKGGREKKGRAGLVSPSLWGGWGDGR
jgi:hypothetical protein